MNESNQNYFYFNKGAFVTMFGPYGHICGIGDVNPNRLTTTTILAADVEERSDESDEEVMSTEFIHPKQLFSASRSDFLHGAQNKQNCRCFALQHFGFGRRMGQKTDQRCQTFTTRSTEGLRKTVRTLGNRTKWEGGAGGSA